MGAGRSAFATYLIYEAIGLALSAMACAALLACIARTSPVRGNVGEAVAAGNPISAPDVGAAADAQPPADCSPGSIVYYASQAPGAFEMDRKGLLYGVETHTAATRVGDIPGLNSCALVAYAILKRAGCNWLKYTPDANAMYEQVAAKGWRRADHQEGGCLVAWNSREPGTRGRIARDRRPGGGVLFRHVGVTTGDWMAVDNTAAWSRPSQFFTWRPYRYEWPIFLCPPAQSTPIQTSSVQR
jgi:hypothetical protein